MANDDHLLSPLATRHQSVRTEQAVNFGQKLGEVEFVGAGLAGGVEVGFAPVALGGCELSIAFTGLATQAMVLVVSQEPGQVAEAGARAGGEAAPAVAIGAHHRSGGQHGVAKLIDLGLLERLEPPGRVGVLVDLVGVGHRHAGCRDALVGPDGGEQTLVWVEPAFLEHGDLSCTCLSTCPAICFIETSPMFLAWQASSARERAEDLSSQGVNWSMITSMKPPSAAAWSCSGRRASWVEAHESHLPRLLECLRGVFHCLAPGPVNLPAAQGVKEKQVNIVCSQRRRADDRAGGSSARLVDMIFGGQEDFLAAPRASPRTIS